MDQSIHKEQVLHGVSLIDDATIELALGIRDSCGRGEGLQERWLSHMVAKFGGMRQRDRDALASALCTVASVLQQQIKFQPKIFTIYIKVEVDGAVDFDLLQRALFDLGCGYSNGGYPLSQLQESFPSNLVGVHVTPTGVMTFSFDREYFENSEDVLTGLPEIILRARERHPQRPDDAGHDMATGEPNDEHPSVRQTP